MVLFRDGLITVVSAAFKGKESDRKINSSDRCIMARQPGSHRPNIVPGSNILTNVSPDFDVYGLEQVI